jgi:phosphonate transport system substrate-binding protein
VAMEESLTRRVLLGVAAAAAMLPAVRRPRAAEPLRFGLTPVFLVSDLALLAGLQRYLEAATGRDVQLVMRRTYQEITALLVSRQLDAAWICGYPFVAYRNDLSLVAVPLWKGQPRYQSYLIAHPAHPASELGDLRGTIHAFSDPDSNSGFLVTRAALAAQGEVPGDFFKRTFFTYGHRNVIRAVATGLATSGSVDGYVYEVLREVEPSLVQATYVVARSEWLGFPPIACATPAARSEKVVELQRALLGMHRDPTGREVLSMLKLDRFGEAEAGLYDGIARRMLEVSGLPQEKR